MNTEVFYIFNSQNEKLRGLSSKPESIEHNLPAICLVHGLALNLHEPGYDQLTEMLVDAGFIVFRIDLSGSGESEGRDLDITLTKWSNDIQLFLEYVRTQLNVDVNKIGIVAHSLGGTATIVSSLEIQGTVLIAPTYNFEETMKNVFKDGFNPNGISTHLITKHHLQANLIKYPLTLNCHRRHLIISF